MLQSFYLMPCPGGLQASLHAHCNIPPLRELLGDQQGIRLSPGPRAAEQRKGNCGVPNDSVNSWLNQPRTSPTSSFMK